MPNHCSSEFRVNVSLNIDNQLTKYGRSNEQTRWEFAINLLKRRPRPPPCCRGWRPLPSCDDPQWTWKETRARSQPASVSCAGSGIFRNMRLFLRERASKSITLNSTLDMRFSVWSILTFMLSTLSYNSLSCCCWCSPREPHALAWGPSSSHTKMFRVERTRLKTGEKVTDSL